MIRVDFVVNVFVLITLLLLAAVIARKFMFDDKIINLIFQKKITFQNSMLLVVTLIDNSINL